MAVARRANRRRYVLLVIVLTALTLITLDTRNGRSGPLGALGRAAHTVVGPIEGAVDDVAGPVSDWWHGVTDAGHLKADNRRLREQLAAAQGEARDAQHDIDENETLKQILDLRSRLRAKNVTGLIVGRDPGNFDSTLTIDKGSESGIAVNMAAMSPAGLVGRVIEVWRGGAKIRVLTDPDLHVGVTTPAHPPALAGNGIASGQNGSHEIVATFDEGSVVKVGDEVYTSALSTLFPPDIPVGTVTKVAEQLGGGGLTVTIKPFVDIGGLQYLTVLEWVQGEPPALVTTTTSTTSTTSTTVPGFFTTTTVVGG